MRRASFRCAVQPTTFGESFDHGTLAGESWSPSLNRVVSNRRNARLMSSSVSSPSTTASCSLQKVQPQLRSQPFLTASAAEAGASGCDFVIVVKIVNRAAVGQHVTGKAPFVAENFLEQRRAGATRLAIGAVVCAHHRLDFCLHHRRLEMRQVRLMQVALVDDGVELVTARLRAAVDSKMFRAGCHLKVVRIVALQTFDQRHAHTAGQCGHSP